MNPWLRYWLVPFLFLFNVSATLAIFAGLDLVGVWSAPVEWITAYLSQFDTAGTMLWFFLAINVAIAGLLLLLAVPLYFFRRDIRQTIERFGVFETGVAADDADPYEEAARRTFEANPETAVYCYGHTHRPSVRAVEGGLLVNSGTWLKRLHRRDGLVGLLPPVFYPSYQLTAVRITEAEAGVTVDFEAVEKPSPAPEELTFTERLLTLGRQPSPELPDRTVVDEEMTVSTPEEFD
jgi:hypothetical protein